MTAETINHRPPWYDPLPTGYFLRRSHRRAFMAWLEEKLELREPEDWYILTRRIIIDCGGQGLLKWHGREPILGMLDEYLPPYDWKPWLFPRVPRGFWQVPENCRRYLDWLGEQLGYQSPEDWYRVTGKDLVAHRGATLLSRFHDSISQIIMTYFPEHQWHEWRFVRAPGGFWDDHRNRRHYLDWLGERLGYETMEDWYRIHGDDLLNNYGNSLLKRFHQHPGLIVIGHFPEHDWQEWKFIEVQDGFWDEPDSRRRYLDWLGERLGYREMEDWYQVHGKDFLAHRGAVLLRRFDQRPVELLRATYAEYDWKEWRFQFVPSQFWDEPANRLRYLDWLGEQLEFEEPDDWYSLTHSDLVEHHGLGLYRRLKRVSEIVRYRWPDREWHDWLFTHAYPGFWDHPDNCRRYLDWLGARLGFDEPKDWKRLTRRHLVEHGGGTLLLYSGSLREVLNRYVPGVRIEKATP